MNSSGGNRRKLTTGGGISDAAFSPDGTRIIYNKVATGGLADLFVMKANGTNVVQLTRTATVEEQFPSWSPDGTKVVFELSKPVGGSPYRTPCGPPTGS
ncbi:MAG: hypothetical protein V9G19_25630 [Tetrasphaera sp.]